jgi:hypothetical protein
MAAAVAVSQVVNNSFSPCVYIQLPASEQMLLKIDSSGQSDANVVGLIVHDSGK